MKKILVTYQIPKEGLNDLFQNYKVIYPDKTVLNYKELLSSISEYDAIISPNLKIDEGLMDQAKKLKIISNYGAGYDNVHVKYATNKGIVVTNTPYSVTEATAELAFGLMLSVMRRVTELDRRLRGGRDLKWGVVENFGQTLYGKTIGIIGMGRIGSAIARRAAVFGMNICYHNRNRLTDELENLIKASYLTLEELLKKSDVISVNTPLTSNTYHLIGKKEFALMKPSAYIINTARGAVIDEQALIQYLKIGKIGGAGLDVFENEPIISTELLKMDQTVLTPHIGTDTFNTNIEMANEAAQNIIDYFEGRRPKSIVNPEVLTVKT